MKPFSGINIVFCSKDTFNQEIEEFCNYIIHIMPPLKIINFKLPIQISPNELKVVDKRKIPYKSSIVFACQSSYTINYGGSRAVLNETPIFVFVYKNTINYSSISLFIGTKHNIYISPTILKKFKPYNNNTLKTMIIKSNNFSNFVFVNTHYNIKTFKMDIIKDLPNNNLTNNSYEEWIEFIIDNQIKYNIIEDNFNHYICVC